MPSAGASKSSNWRKPPERKEPAFASHLVLAIRLLVRLHELPRKSERHCALDPVVLDRVLLIDRGQIVFEAIQRPRAIGVNQLDDCSHTFCSSVSRLLQEESKMNVRLFRA